MEIQVIMSMLKIIDNPINDIALVTVLRSMIGGFTDNELVSLRIESKAKSFYESMVEYEKRENIDTKLKDKIEDFLNKLEQFRKCKEYMPLNEFIWKIYQDTGYYNYVSLMPNGTLRAANLKILFEKAKQYEKTSFRGLYSFITFIDKLNFSNKDMSGAKLIGENEDVVRIMSIHKSKGLEFPVVFLSGTSKKFNMRDLNTNPILLHHDIGLGPKYINYEEGITYSTLAREAIKYISKTELISEEMRILYVALTRAKEKLIITGIEKDYKKSSDKKEEELDTYRDIDEANKINKNIVQKYLNYLDWIELVYLKLGKQLEGILEIKIHKKEEILQNVYKEENKEIDIKDEINKIDKKKLEILKKKLEWEYEYKTINKIMTKSSVTKIKNMKLDLKEEFQTNYNTPEFLKEEKEISASEKGTLVHLCLRNLNEKIEYTKEKIDKLLKDMQSRNIIKEKERQAIDIDKIYNFTKTNIWKQMQTAKEVQKEKPFYINIEAKEIYDEDIEEKVLVQGIIDLYYRTEDDELILVDYKTDKISIETEFIEKYKMQLEIYKRALEEALNRKVDKIYIYSVYLNKEIEI